MDLNLEEIEKQEGSPFVERFEEFYNAEYKKQIERIVEAYPEEKSLVVDFKALEKFDPILADELLDNPDAVTEAAHTAIQNIHIPTLTSETFKPNVRFSNLPKDREISIKDISAKYLNKMLCVEGVLRQITSVMPKLTVAVWKCKRCGNIYKVPQEKQVVRPPGICECHSKDFELIEEKSQFIDWQKIEIQEPLEKLKGNEQAEYIKVYVTEDLVNKVSAGDKTKFVGVLRLLPPDKDKKNIYGKYLECSYLEETAKEFLEVDVTKEEEEEIKRLSKNPDIYKMLAQSVATGIYGHDVIKESIALQLFGGVTKHLPGDQKIRGNIHVLLIGDPGCIVADERIVMGDGTIKMMGALGEEHLQKINFQVLTGEGGKKRDWASTFFSYPQQKVMEIITESGKSIKGTHNHPLLWVTKEKGQVKRTWKRLDEFKVNDKVAIVNYIPCTITKYTPTNFETLPQTKGPKFKGKLPKKVTPKLAGLLGYMLGDGWVRKKEACFIVADPEKDILPILTNIVEKLFGIRPAITSKIPKNRKMLMHTVGIHSGDVAHNLFMLRKKRVPKIILESGNEVVAEFIKWLFEADGCVFSKGRGSRAVSLKAKNIELLRDVQILLLRFSIHSRIVGNALMIRRGESMQKFGEKIGFASHKKKEKMKEAIENAEEHARVGQQHSEKIVKIIDHGLEDVYDIEVPKGHRFIANGIVSHNSGKSQLLQATNNIAPKSIYISGKTTSGVGLCVAPDTFVLNDSGLKPIKEFVEENFVEEGKEEIPGAWSTTFDGKAPTFDNKLNLMEGKISKVWRIKAPEKMITLTTTTKKSLSLTPNTSLLKKTKNNIKWTKSSEIKKGDVVAGVKNFKQNNLSATWETIFSKEEFKPQYEHVYDFTVEGTHNFIANGFITHNTASAVKDEFGEGGWTLKAGALVLSSGGVCMADELDKMDTEDRSALHEAMEQGMISVAKAGIVTRFKADTSLLAAANPKDSRFDPHEPFLSQINLPPSLISRFDLFFMIRDILDKKKDQEISSHILKTHQSGEKIAQSHQKGTVLKKEEQEEIKKITEPAISQELFRKYVSFARQKCYPVMSGESIDAISKFYVDLRDQGRQQGAYPATARQLEGLVRLAEASARVRLSDVVEVKDAEKAIFLVRESMKETLTDPETGRIDIDIVTTGVTQARQNAINTVMRIVKETMATGIDMVPIEEIVMKAKEQGMDEEKTNAIIDELAKSGKIYMPRHHYVKPVDRNKE